MSVEVKSRLGNKITSTIFNKDGKRWEIVLLVMEMRRIPLKKIINVMLNI